VALTIVIFCLVAFLAVTQADVQRADRTSRARVRSGVPIAEPSHEGTD
jgi:hypothetical protein